MTLSIMKLSIKTLNKKTLSMMKYRASWCYALFMLIVANKSFMMSAVILNVVFLSAVAPYRLMLSLYQFSSIKWVNLNQILNLIMWTIFNNKNRDISIVYQVKIELSKL
jgi:hypothetical protein